MTPPQIIDMPAHRLGGTAVKDSHSTIERECADQMDHKEPLLRINAPKYAPSGSGPAYCGPGDQLTFLITGRETEGAFFLAEMSVAPGGGPPPHIHHRENESFRILEGTLTIQVGGNTITASAGDFAYLPRGIAHSFKNTGEVTAKALVLVTPAGLEDFFAEGFEPTADRNAPPPVAGPEMIARLLRTAPAYGLEFLSPA